MDKQLLFWMIYIISIVVGFWSGNLPDGSWGRRWGGSLVQFILIGLLGWAVFGAAVK